MNEEGDDFSGVISVWDIIALFAHLVKNLFASFEEFFDVHQQAID